MALENKCARSLSPFVMCAKNYCNELKHFECVLFVFDLPVWLISFDVPVVNVYILPGYSRARVMPRPKITECVFKCSLLIYKLCLQ